MSFFDDIPAPEPEPPRQHHHWEPPEAEFPGIVPAGSRPDDLSHRAPPHSLRFGLQLADGTRVIGGDRELRGSEPTGPVLEPVMSGGSRLAQVSRWWAWPLPPKGALDFVTEWPAYGLAESRVTLDAGLILAAAQHSIPLWPAA